MAKKAATKKKKAKPRRPPPSPPQSPPPSLQPPPKRNWRRWGAAAAGVAAAATAATLLTRFGLPAWRRRGVEATIDATPAAGTYDDGMADVVVDVDPAEQAFIESIPNQDPTERNMWAIGLLGEVADRHDEGTPQHKLARYLQAYIVGSTGDGSTFDSHGITSMRTGETIPLYAAAAPLFQLAEPRLRGPHDRARASGDLYDVVYEF